MSLDLDSGALEAMDSQPARQRRGWWAHTTDWARRRGVERILMIVLLVAAVLSGIATFGTVTGRLPGTTGESGNTLLFVLLLIDLILLLLLSIIVVRRLVVIWVERRRGLAGSRLHSRLVGFFSLLAIAPAILVAIFSAVLFDFGLQVWFSDQVSAVVRNSRTVAEAYLEEHQRAVVGDAIAIGRALSRSGPVGLVDPRAVQAALNQQTRQRGLTEAMVFDGAGHELARSGFLVFADFDPKDLSTVELNQARRGDVLVLSQREGARVGALLYLDGISDTFLYLGQEIDPRILGYLSQSRSAVQLYQELEGQRHDLQVTFALVFAIVAGLLLLVAVWIGLAVANLLTRPVSRLIGAAERVAGGDLSARVPVSDSGDEVATLQRSFNRMTEQLEGQHLSLLDLNRQSEERRRFIETVLGGVSSAVFGLDSDGRVEVMNRAAEDLLRMDYEALSGKEISGQVPEISLLLRAVRMRPGRYAERQLSLLRSDGENRTIIARMVMEQTAGEGRAGKIICTIDDVTDLVGAQRKAAWADVARRIAHEIKNPLTPIQLSAERLKRRYSKQIVDDPDTFKLCTDTIVRQVTDIGRMVDEFSAFARMPAAVFSENDLVALIQEAVFLQRQSYPEIAIRVAEQPARLLVKCDRQQIGRALTNVLQNAAQAVSQRMANDAEAGLAEIAPGAIDIAIRNEGRSVAVVVEDNGSGLPAENRDRLTEPYVTTRKKGTGLGLAIVKKIMEEHGGEVRLATRPEGGASVTLSIAARGLHTDQEDFAEAL